MDLIEAYDKVDIKELWEVLPLQYTGKATECY